MLLLQFSDYKTVSYCAAVAVSVAVSLFEK